MFPVIRSRDLKPVSNRRLCTNVTGSSYFVERLKLDKKLSVHNGCVNTVCWNDNGTLLLSGSDDQHLVVSNPFTGKIVTKVRSGHRSNIFCARFLPGSQDREVISCSGSGDIFYTDLDRDDLQDTNRFGCHFGTTYKIVVVPNESSTFLSCGDDGTVRFFDLRVRTSCSRTSCDEDVIINLQNSVSSMAVDPVIPYQLAVGSADGFVRIYDRRMLKAREKGGNPKSLICVFQSPMSKTEKRHFRITSLNYRPGSHDILVNYSSENIYLFNTYDVETTQKYSLEVPNTTRRKSALQDNSVAMGGSTESEEMDEFIGFSPEERRGPSTLYRPIRRLRLRGDWSDTGPNARPENEGQAPTSMIMQRMSDLLTRMLNTHVNEPLTESRRSEEDGASGRQRSSQDGASGRQRSSEDGASNRLALATIDLPSSNVNPALPLHSTLLSSLRHRSQSISREGLVSPGLSSQESSVVEQYAEEQSVADGGQNVSSDTRNHDLKSSQGGDQDLVESKVIVESEGQTHKYRKTFRDDPVGSLVSDDPLCPSNDSDQTLLVVPSEDDTKLESHSAAGQGISVSDNQFQFFEHERVDNVINEDIDNKAAIDESSCRRISSSHPLSSDTACCTPKMEEKTLDSDFNDKIVNSSVSEDERNDSVNICDVREFFQCNSLSSESKCHVSAEDKENPFTSGSFSHPSKDLAQSQLSISNLASDGESKVLSSNLSAEDKEEDTAALATGHPLYSEERHSGNTLSDLTSLTFDVSWHSFTEGSSDSLSFTHNQRERKDTPGVNFNQKWISKCEENDSVPISHSLKCVEEEEDTTGSVGVKGQGHLEHFTMENSQQGSGSREKIKVGSKNVEDGSSFSSEKGSVKLYSGKGKGTGKSSKKLQDGSQGTQGSLSAPYNDGNMKFAVSEKTSIAGNDSNNAMDTDELASASANKDASNQEMKGMAEVEDSKQTDNVDQRVTHSCQCQALPSTSRGNRSGESSGTMQQSDSVANRQRRSGYSLPPTGNFQLHSDNEMDDADDEDDTDTVRKIRGHQSKSHAARKIQELFRKRKHAKENAHLLNLPQPRVLMKFSGHRNCRTMIKESNFYGDHYVMSGSDCGRIFIWERETGRLAMYLEADKHVVNCVQPNPHLPVIVSSGIDYDIKVWSPLAQESQFDADVAHTIVQRNELMLVETRDTITVPPALMLRVLASLSHIRAGRIAASQAQPEPEQPQQ